jgi:hypothetical protein
MMGLWSTSGRRENNPPITPITPILFLIVADIRVSVGTRTLEQKPSADCADYTDFSLIVAADRGVIDGPGVLRLSRGERLRGSASAASRMAEGTFDDCAQFAGWHGDVRQDQERIGGIGGLFSVRQAPPRSPRLRSPRPAAPRHRLIPSPTLRIVVACQRPNPRSRNETRTPSNHVLNVV